VYSSYILYRPDIDTDIGNDIENATQLLYRPDIGIGNAALISARHRICMQRSSYIGLTSNMQRSSYIGLTSDMQRSSNIGLTSDMQRSSNIGLTSYIQCHRLCTDFEGKKTHTTKTISISPASRESTINTIH